jgi:ATP-binding cassette subfamily B protein
MNNLSRLLQRVATKSFRSQLWRTLSLVWQSSPYWTLANLALFIVQGLLPVLALYLLKLVVETVTGSLALADKGPAYRETAFLIALAALATLVSNACNALSRFVSEAQAQQVSDHIFHILHAKSIEVDLAYYEDSQYYDTLHRAQQEAPYRPTHIVNGLVQIGQNGIVLLAIMGLLVSLHWAVALALFAAYLPGMLARLRYAVKLYQWRRRQTPTERRADYFNWILTRDTYAKELRLFGLGRLFRRQFQEVRRQLRQEKLEIATQRLSGEVITLTGGTLALFGTLFFIVYRTLQGLISLGDLIMYYQAFQRGQEALWRLVGGLLGLYEDSLLLSYLYEFLDIKPRVVEPKRPRPVPRPLQSGIVFDRVSFRYPTGTRPVLAEVSLHIRPGERVAFVGENGSGKTTLIKLLCRLYDPAEGSISLDGIDLREFDTTALRREISIVFQDYARYHLTARENIWFGNSGRPPQQEEIEAAARQAGADEVISSLPRGYDTTLGKWFEEGEELSLGEWQKIALARAFLRDAQIIVLDEPTSALDAQAEYKVFKQFYQLTTGRTAILISHRLSTVSMADRIYVLAQGGIAESGTHSELLRHDGIYARLFKTQARYYQYENVD